VTPRPSPAAVAAAYRDLARRYVADLAKREAELAAAEATIGKLSAALAESEGALAAADLRNAELHAAVDGAFVLGWKARGEARDALQEGAQTLSAERYPGRTVHIDIDPQPGWAPGWLN